MMPHAQWSLFTPAFVFVAAGPSFALPRHGAGVLGIGHAELAPIDLLPAALVLGAAVLTWLLGNRTPRLQPAPARKPKQRSHRDSR